MANTTIRQLGDASSLKANDYLLIAQEDGTTKKVPLNRLISEGMVASDSSGETAMVTRAKIWVGGGSSLTDLTGVERSASDYWDDKAWNLVFPGRGNTAEDIKATDFCHFVAVHQPVPMFVLNRPFMNLHEAMTWARYNVPGGWELQFDIVASTHCFEKADKLGQFGTHLTSNMNLRTISFIGKHRFVGSYNEDLKVWDTGKGHADDKYNWTRWVPDAKGQGGPNSESVNRGTYTVDTYKDRRGISTEPCAALDDIYVHFAGHAGLRMWFRDIPKIYICGITWGDYAHGPRHGNQRYFRVSNGRLHMFGEALCNLEAAIHAQANQRGNSFISKHASSTILEVMEGGSAYIMCNLRHYSCGTTTSYYDRRQQYVNNAGGTSWGAGGHGRAFSPADVGLSYDAFKAAPQQIVRICEVGSTGSSVSGGSTVIFDPLYSGWYRSLGLLTADRNTLVYHNGTTVASNGALTKAETPADSASFLNWGQWQKYEWLTGSHPNLHDTSWSHYDVESLNWYYLGVTPTGTTDAVGTSSDAAYKWDVSKATSALPWQAWKMASVNAGGVYAELIPGVVPGPYVVNNNHVNNYAEVTGDDTTGARTAQIQNYGYWDGRGFRHWMKSMMSNSQLTSQNVYGVDQVHGAQHGDAMFLQHYSCGKNTRIAATINSPCSSAYSFGSADAKIYLSRHYNVMNYIPDNWAGYPYTNQTGIFKMYNDLFGGITTHSWHVNTSSGTHFTKLPGNVYPCPNTITNPFGAFRYQENNAFVDHNVLCDEIKNYPIIGGGEYVKFSEYPGELKEFIGAGNSAASGIGVGNLYITQIPVINEAAAIPANSGTWAGHGAAQYQFSHQNYKANTDDATGHAHLPKPLATYRTTWTSGVAEDEIIMYWFDLESRPAVHNFTTGINLLKEPYWWPEHNAFYWNQSMPGTAKTFGSADIYGSGA